MQSGNNSISNRKMKSLKPSHREKKRYLLLEGKIGKKTIDDAVLDYIGILGYAKASPQVVKKGENTILAVNRGSLDKVKAGFLFKKIKILKVSGTLKKLK